MRTFLKPVAQVLAAVVALSVAPAARARGPIGEPGGGGVDCTAPRCAVEDTVASACPCDDTTTHARYLRCVKNAAKGLSLLGALPSECRSAVVACARRSTCGTPARVACWVTATATSCGIKSAGRCQRVGGTAQAGSCCSACPTTTTTETTTTSTMTGTSTTETTTTSTTSTTVVLLCSGGAAYPICTGSCPTNYVCTVDAVISQCVCVALP